jgi:ABC-type spermidine/putrescine transport system permease subunit II
MPSGRAPAAGRGFFTCCARCSFEGRWYTSAVGAQLSWTLPFGVLVMFAVMSRFDRTWEEAAYDLGASRWQAIRLVVIPILAPGLVAVALFGFTLSYDEFARTLQTPDRSTRCRSKSGP